MNKALIILTIVTIYASVSLSIAHMTGQDLLYNPTQQALPQVPNVNAITFVSFINGGLVVFAKLFIFQVPNVPALVNVLWYLLAIVLLAVLIDWAIELLNALANLVP